MSHPFSNFKKYINTPFMRKILPIIPAGAKIAEESKLKAEQLGKIPGKFAHGPKVWFGFTGWESYFTSQFDLDRWEEWQQPDKADTAIAIGMRLGDVVAIDIDEDGEEDAAHLENLGRIVLGQPMCVRRRVGSARRVLFYPHKPGAFPIRKARVAWTMGGGEKVSAVDMLGLGQQVVIEGPHAKGEMQYWLDDCGLTDVGLLPQAEKDKIAWLEEEDTFRYTMAVTEWAKGSGRTLHQSGGKAREGNPTERHEIDNPASPLAINDKELSTLITAMKAINLDDPRIDYDRFILLQRALCAATYRDINFLHEVVWPWVCESQTIARGAGPRTEERGIEWLEDVWRGFKDSEVGAPTVYGIAKAFGFKDPRDEIDDEQLARFWGEPIDPGKGESGDQGDNAGAVSGAAGAVPGLAAGSGPAIFRAELDPEDSDRPRRRDIQLDGDYLATAVDEVEAGMLEQGVGLFSRGDAIVRPGAAKIKISKGREIEGERLYPIVAAELREHMTQAARFVKWVQGISQWVPTNAPEDVARAYLARVGRWQLRPLSGIITAPTLRADGSLVDKPGYDDETGLLYRPDPTLKWKPISPHPSKEEAMLALAVLKGLILTFPFVSRADLSVALSGILTAVVRRPLPSAPLHAMSSPTAGTGKGKLVDIAGSIATGREASADVQGRNEEEMEKRLVALLKTGDPVLLIDNCTLPIEGDFLCAMLTREYVQPRILGTHDAPRMPTNAMMFATGNNIVINADMVRRSLLCQIDAGVESPEQRIFDYDPVEEAKQHRAWYLGAALTVMRAYAVAGRPPQSDPLGSFEAWNHVRDALIWLGEVDPCATQKELKQVSPEHGELASLLSAWYEALGNMEAVTKEVLQTGAGSGDLLDALRNVAGSSAQDALHGINPRKLGWYLKRHDKRIAGGFQLCKAGTKRNEVIWKVVKLT